MTTEQQIPNGPTVYRSADGYLTVEYPYGRPHWFAITPELFDDMVAQLNDRLPQSPDAATASGTPNETGDTK